MNRAEKAAVIDEIAANITDASAIFAVDYRGITVEQARDLRARLRAADATFRVVKNSLTERAADAAGAERLKSLLEGPTALTFVRGDGAAAAKALADFARVTQLLAFKGGLMDGAALSPAEITAISRLPSREVLYGQLVGLVASPISGLARTLNALIANLAVGLGQVRDQKQAAEPAPAEPPADVASTEAQAPTEEPGDEPADQVVTAQQSGASEPEEESPKASSDEPEPEEESPKASSDEPEDAPTDASTSDDE
jgi:large subunit ribosomal protein L10